ncbi:MAG: extracellular solute-binding protein [Treponema sp.]|nr:extracellular solute-binding protein [Treponema sp.]
MKAVKIFICFMVFTLSGVMLFAGGGQQAPVTGSIDTSVYSSLVTPPGQFPIVNSPAAMRVFTVQTAGIEDFTTNDFTISYEQKTGVHINWELAPATQGSQMFNLSLASGDYPDVYMAMFVSKEDEILYGSQGVFIPLNKLIETYSPNTVQQLADFPEIKAMVTTPDGNMYSLPYIAQTYHMYFPFKLWMNTTWLNNLNLKTPSTTEEFYQTLKAFKERDPNGNGSGKNVIPFFDTDPFRDQVNRIGPTSFVTFFINSFIQCDYDFRYVTDDNKIVFAFDKPEFREGLRYVRKLVSEGLIDEASFSALPEQLRRVADSDGDLILGATVQRAPSAFMNMNGDKQKNYDSVPPLAGPNGVRFAVYNPEASFTSGQFIITKSMKNPEIACRWVDYFYTWEGGLEARYGREGQEWERAKPGEITNGGQPALWRPLTALAGVQNVCWRTNIGQYYPQDKQMSNPDIYAPDGLEARLYAATRDNYVPYAPKKYIPQLYMTSDVLKKINQPSIDMRNYVAECIVRFCTGDLSLDKDWDSYVSNLSKMGIPDILAASQAAYDSFLKNQNN